MAACDINLDNLEETARQAEKDAPAGTRITTHRCDVGVEADMQRFRDEVLAQHATDHVNLVFNNAGDRRRRQLPPRQPSGVGPHLRDLLGRRLQRLPGLRAAARRRRRGPPVNTSSVNGFWASLGPGMPHTAYSAAKFAVKGFIEALLEDFRLNAPHVGVSVVMPGHIGTEIVNNSRKLFERLEGAERHGRTMREGMARRGHPHARAWTTTPSAR